MATETAEVNVVRFSPDIECRETHLEYTVFFECNDGRTRWASGVMNRYYYADAAALQHAVLALQTEFVRNQWLRMEVCVPNRNRHGGIESGFIKDTGVLLATRQLA